MRLRWMRRRRCVCSAASARRSITRSSRQFPKPSISKAIFWNSCRAVEQRTHVLLLECVNSHAAPPAPAAVGGMALDARAPAQRAPRVAVVALRSVRLRDRLSRHRIHALPRGPRLSLPFSDRRLAALPADSLPDLRFLLRDAGLLEPHHRLLDAVQKPRDAVAADTASAASECVSLEIYRSARGLLVGAHFSQRPDDGGFRCGPWRRAVLLFSSRAGLRAICGAAGTLRFMDHSSARPRPGKTSCEANRYPARGELSGCLLYTSDAADE